MTRTTGVPLVAPFGRADRIHDALPQNVQDLVDQSAAVDHSVVRSDGGIFHHGSLRAIADSIDEIRTEFNIGTGQLSLEEIGDSDFNRERLGTVTAIEGRALAGEQLGSLSLIFQQLESLSPISLRTGPRLKDSGSGVDRRRRLPRASQFRQRTAQDPRR